MYCVRSLRAILFAIAKFLFCFRSKLCAVEAIMFLLQYVPLSRRRPRWPMSLYRATLWNLNHSNCQGCRGDWILMPMPIPYPQKNLWESPQNPHINRIPKSSIPVPYTLCIFVWWIYHFIFLSCMPFVCSIIVGYVLSTVLRDAWTS